MLCYIYPRFANRVPPRRPSPYNVTKFTSFEAGGGGVARVNSTGKHFFTRSPHPSSPATSATGSAYASTHSRAELEGALLAQAAAASAAGAGGDNGCRLSSSAEARMAALGRGGSNDHPRSSSSALMAGTASSATFKTAPAARGAQVDVVGGATLPRTAEMAVVEARGGAGLAVGASSAAAAGVHERSAARAFVGFPASPASLRNSAKGSVTSTEEDFPPGIEALQMVQAASGGGGGKNGAAARVVVVTAAAAAAATAASAATAAALVASGGRRSRKSTSWAEPAEIRATSSDGEGGGGFGERGAGGRSVNHCLLFFLAPSRSCVGRCLLLCLCLL